MSKVRSLLCVDISKLTVGQFYITNRRRIDQWVVGRHRTNERMKFIDYYSEQSCTAGRAAFIVGQHV